jgi:hypothetical protein
MPGEDRGACGGETFSQLDKELYSVSVRSRSFGGEFPSPDDPGSGGPRSFGGPGVSVALTGQLASLMSQPGGSRQAAAMMTRRGCSRYGWVVSTRPTRRPSSSSSLTRQYCACAADSVRRTWRSLWRCCATDADATAERTHLLGDRAGRLAPGKIATRRPARPVWLSLPARARIDTWAIPPIWSPSACGWRSTWLNLVKR